MNESASHSALHAQLKQLNDTERTILARVLERQPTRRPVEDEDDAAAPLGARVADRVAAFGGSWTFIVLFGVTLLMWILLNTGVLLSANSIFDPYPFILLNLFLSMIAAIQAPVILMSQNRQAERDRMAAANDYEVNLKAEMDILALHQKLDELREVQWSELVALQHRQIALLEAVLAQRASSPPRTNIAPEA